MIRHVVSLQLGATAEGRRTQDALAVRERLRALRDVAPGILTLGVFTHVSDVSPH